MKRSPRSWSFACVLLTFTVACEWSPLEVEAPTNLGEEDFLTPEGAEILRVTALAELNQAFTTSSSLVEAVGLFTDEFIADPNQRFYALVGRENTYQAYDQRTTEAFFASRLLHGARLTATNALHALRATDGLPTHIGQMFAIRGLGKAFLADAVCPGQAFNLYEDSRVVFTDPLSTEEAYESALVDIDSAAVFAADDERILNLARAVRARVLLELGRFDEAAAAAAAVPTSYSYDVEFGGVFRHGLTDITALFTPLGVSDGEGGNGLPYVSANDPRVPTEFGRMAYDGVTEMYALRKYPTSTTSIPLASGLEARLIEAEAALRAGDGQWLDILNELRSTQIDPPMAALDDPGTEVARVDLLFRERAFWLFATGRRLGDLRRLVRFYGRAAEEIYPTGDYWLGGSYEPVYSFPLPESERLNPAVTGCTDR